MEKDDIEKPTEALIEDDQFVESFDDGSGEEDYSDVDDEAEEELFKENPLKAIWFKLKEINGEN